MHLFEQLPADWKTLLQEELQKEYITQLSDYVLSEYQSNTVFPLKNNIFKAFEYCKYENTKVVILGQDPYHSQGQADGLCFSVKEGVALPPSLKNIFKEISTDLGLALFPASGDLKHWSKQGVLLLNTVLSVREATPNSHKNRGWELFTNAIIQKLSSTQSNLVFLLWGANAQKKSKHINPQLHCVLMANHPSPLSANRGGWFGNKHFSKTNQYLIENNKNQIYW